MISKRRKRRQRGKMKDLLDAIALRRISENMLWSMATWNGVRCPGCGIKVRPSWLTNLSGRWGNGWITGFGSACHKTKCPGENPNWETTCK
jgi:hypothetical protein